MGYVNHVHVDGTFKWSNEDWRMLTKFAKEANQLIMDAMGDVVSETVRQHRLQYFALEIVPYEDIVEQDTHVVDVTSDVTECIQQGTLHTNYWFRDVFILFLSCNHGSIF